MHMPAASHDSNIWWHFWHRFLFPAPRQILMVASPSGTKNRRVYHSSCPHAFFAADVLKQLNSPIRFLLHCTSTRNWVEINFTSTSFLSLPTVWNSISKMLRGTHQGFPLYFHNNLWNLKFLQFILSGFNDINNLPHNLSMKSKFYLSSGNSQSPNMN